VPGDSPEVLAGCCEGETGGIFVYYPGGDLALGTAHSMFRVCIPLYVMCDLGPRCQDPRLL